MAKFTNIKNDDQKPLMVDVENVAVLIDCTNEHQKGLYLSDIRQGRTQSVQLGTPIRPSPTGRHP